ncbi:MAG: MmcQ/YjbR family DNA-binding protein [Bacteroidaceae bacterium]|nr:MmcQ/YjbR family DNA-binding protein [Bacteroidaceae bacterium]
MNIEDYRNLCLSMGDDVEERLPFTAFRAAQDVLAFYVHEHIFAICDISDFRTVTLKCQPERIGELKEQHPEISQPFNLSPKHWIGVSTDADKSLLESLTRNSYELVKNKYPTKSKKRKGNS